ncbi:MAG: alpha/beta fold hydrolase [Candidatus Pristimantibacillus sp.]
MNIFMTGGTGFIGRQLLLQLATHTRSHHIYVLVRSHTRFQQIMKRLNLREGNITPVIGDLSQPQFGLQEDDYQRILSVDIIIHAGGPMNIELSHTQAEQMFLQPAIEIVDLAKAIHAAKGLHHFIHVVGFMSPYNEHNAAVEPLASSLPPYEQMKFQADSLIRNSLRTLQIPLSTVNPSVVIGDSYSGATEQIGGLSILVDSVRRKLMPSTPGGANYWLPMVHVDHVASFISTLVELDAVESNTYYLLDQKQESLSITELLNLIAVELRERPPVGTVPLPLLKAILALGAGKRLGIPKESMNFLVKQTFPTQSKSAIEQKSGNAVSIASSTLPYVVADLDYRLSHPESNEAHNFSQCRRSDLISLERSTQGDAHGIPILFLHGTFSGADCFVPIVESMTDSNVLLVDLPGFGRTPYHHNPSVIDGYVEAVTKMIVNLNTPVILAGHSFGGLIAAKVMERIDAHIQQLLLLQPVLHPIASMYRHSLLTNTMLKYMTRSRFKKTLLQSSEFALNDKGLDPYAAYVIDDLKSPRVRKTTAVVMSSLTNSEPFQLQPHSWNTDKVRLLWGEQDNQYHIPTGYERMATTYIPYGHQFPISQPEATASWIRQQIT